MIVAFSASPDNMILAFIVIFLAELSLAPVLFAIFLYFFSFSSTSHSLDWKIYILFILLQLKNINRDLSHI